MQVLSLPASMQQELAARALRACMAAEAALASLRAECKPLQAVSPQRGLELKKNMGNAHRSLRLQIEACENFSLSATAAFKQLCDVFFNGDSGSNFRFHHTNLSHVHSPSMSSMTRLSSVAGNLDGDLPDCGAWRPELDVVSESSPVYKEKEIGDTGISAPEKHSAGVQVETLERSVAWKLDNEGLHSRLASPKTCLMATNNSDEDAAAAAPRSNDEAGQDLDPTAREPPNHQDANTVESTEFQESRIDEDSDASDSDVELNCEISSLRRNSTLPVKYTNSQHDDAAALDNKNSEFYRLAAVSADGVPCSSTMEDKPTSDPAPRSFEYENHATQTGEASTDSEKNSCVGESNVSSKRHHHQKIRVQAPDGGNLLANSTLGLLPATPPSTAFETQGRCDAHKDEAQPRDLQVMQNAIPPAQPPLPRVHASWAITEMTCTQAPTPSSSPPHFSWSSEAAHNVESPNQGHSDVLLENHNPLAVSYASTRASFTCLKSLSPDLPLYSSRPQFQNPPLKGGNSQQEHHHSSSAATLANGIVPEKASSFFESRGDLMVPLQMKKENSFAPSNHTPPYTDQNYFEEPNVVPVAPSPYMLKARSMFTRTTSSPAHKLMSDLPVPSSVQGSNEHYGTSLYAMAAAISVTPGYRRSSSGLGMMSSASLSSPYEPTAERQHKHNLVSTERPQLTQYSIYPMSTTLASSSSSSWDTTSSKASAGCDKSSRPKGGVEYYRKEFEHLQEQFPRAHGSFHEGHLKMLDNNTSQGITLNPQHEQFGLPLPTPSSATSTTLQNMRKMSCTAMPQRPQMRAVITAMEHQGGLPYNEGYNHVMRQNGAKGRAIGGGGYMQYISGESTGYGSKVCLDSQSADDGMKGSNLGAIKFPDNCSVRGQSRKSSMGIRDLMETGLNKSELPQELASWPGLRLSWDEDSTDGEGEKPSDCKMTDSGLGGGMEQAEEMDSDEDDDSLGTQGEWQAILGSLRKGDKSNLGASSILKRGIASCPSI